MSCSLNKFHVFAICKHTKQATIIFLLLLICPSFLSAYKANAQEEDNLKEVNQLRFELQLKENALSSDRQSHSQRLLDVANYTFDLSRPVDEIPDPKFALEDPQVTVSDRVVSFNGILKLLYQITPNIEESRPLTFSGILIVDKIQKNILTGEMMYIFNKDSTVTVGLFTSADSVPNIELVLFDGNQSGDILNGTVSIAGPLL